MKCKITCCKFNVAIDCTEHDHCNKCGWNPKVAAKRIEKIKKERGLI